MAELTSYGAGHIDYNYDNTLIGAVDKDPLYADPNDTDNIWPKGHIRINTAQWANSMLGINSPDRVIRLETFNGKIYESHSITYYTPEELEREKEAIKDAPLMKAFIQSPFYDVEVINKETTRFIEALNKREYDFQAWKKTFDPDEYEQYETWKKSKGDTETSMDNTVTRTVWDILSNATTEDLFKFKLDIFEQEIVQNSEIRELRSKIRKAKSVCEVCAAYQELLDAESPEEGKAE